MGEEIVKSNRVYLWDNLKIILILFVVIHHASIPYVVIKGQHWTEVLYMVIMPYTMSTFTIISGYWFKTRSLSDLIKRFLFPCLMITFLAYGLRFYSPITFMSYFSPWRFDIMWYLWVIFVYYLISPKLLHFGINKLLMASVLLSLLAGCISYVNGAFALSRMIGFYPFFLLGMKLRRFGKFEEYINNKRLVVLARFVFVITLALYMLAFLYERSIHTYTTFSHPYDVYWFGIVVRILTYIACTILSISLILSMPNKQYWFTKYGSRTMTPYILHPLLLYIFSWNLAIPFMDKWYGYMFYMLVIPALSMMTVHSKIDGFVKKLTS